jgi:hypothetical protein
MGGSCSPDGSTETAGRVEASAGRMQATGAGSHSSGARRPSLSDAASAGERR